MALLADSASQRLAREITKRVRDTGLVLWVDADRRYSDFVTALGQKAFEFEYPVVTFRGSYLELMLALEPYGNGHAAALRVTRVAPQADFLFDRGFISFGEGRVLVSERADEASLLKLGVDP